MGVRRMEAYRDEKNEYYTDKIFELTEKMPGYVRRFANEYLVTRNKAPRTVCGYVGDLLVFYTFLQNTRGISVEEATVDYLASLTADDMQDYMTYLMSYRKRDPHTQKLVKVTNKAPSRARKLSSLRALYKYLVSHNYLDKNVAELIDMPKIEEKPVVYLQKDEVTDVLQGAETGEALTDTQNRIAKKQHFRDLAILTLLLNTGIRVSEMVGIDLQDIDWKEKRIRIFRKGRKEQYVYMNELVVDALRDYIEYERKPGPEDEEQKALFLSRKKGRLSVRAAERLVQKYTASTVPLKKISPHKLRSTFATNLYEETGDIYITSDALGHSSLETVKKYTNLSDERRRQAADAIEKAYYPAEVREKGYSPLKKEHDSTDTDTVETTNG